MEETSFLYQFRVIVVGNSKVGKSALITRFVDGTYKDDNDATVGVMFYAKVVDIGDSRSKPVKLQLWDTAGQERYRSITKSYYRNVAGCMLVFDVTSQNSFDAMTSWLDEARMCADPHEPVFALVGTKRDLDVQRQVSKEAAEGFAQCNGTDYIETSAKTNQNVEEAFKLLAKNIYARMSAKEHRLASHEDSEGIKKGPSAGALRITSSLESSASHEQGRNRKSCC